MIKINDKYSFEKIRGGWALHRINEQLLPGVLCVQTTYHDSLESLSDAFLDETFDKSETLSTALSRLKEAKDELRQAIKGVEL